MVVYLIRNQINGKVYVGKTTKTVAFRWAYHLNNAKRGVGFPLYRALRKYGPDAFTADVIYTAKTQLELNAMETFFIILHQSYLKENGYNLTLGGDGAVGFKRSEEWKQKARERMLAMGPEFGEKIRQAKLGVPLSEAHCRAIGDSKRGAKHPYFGKKRTAHMAMMRLALPAVVSTETRKKQSDAKKDKKLSVAHVQALKNRWTPELRAAQALRMKNQRGANGGNLCS